MHAWGKCHPQDCDWGEVGATPYAQDINGKIESNAVAVSGLFDSGFSQTLVNVRPGDSNLLRAEVFTRFTDGSKRSGYTAEYTFSRKLRRQGPALPQAKPLPAPAPAPTPAPKQAPKQAAAQLPSIDQECIPFNPETAELKNIDGRWSIVDGDRLLFSFGSQMLHAQKALSIIRHYRMNQSCSAGSPETEFRYLLVNGKAPQGSMPREDFASFNPNAIEVKSIGGRWKIVDGSNWIFDFGNREEDARKAFAIIKKYGFTRTCYVGRPNPTFIYLRK
jgi:hypothetical protein